MHHYFGIKQQLFVTAVRFPFQPAEVVDQLVGGDRGTAGERLVRWFLSLGEDEAKRDAVSGLLRSAAATEHAAALLRPTLVTSQLIGLFMLRCIIKVEPLASATVQEVVAAVVPTVQSYLTTKLNLQPSV